MLPSSNLTEAIESAWPAGDWCDCHVLVALSGGADSVALLRGLLDRKQATNGAGQVMAAHFNHQLRGDESDADQSWAQDLCQRLGVDLKIGQAGDDIGSDSENAARDARYAFLLETAEATGARYIATAHTAGDQIETVLMRMLRGSGLAGLAGIPFARALSASVTLVRPMLGVDREQIEKFLTGLGQDYRTDSSNSHLRYTRNWIRHELLPLVRKHSPGDPDAAIARLAEQAKDLREAIDFIVQPLAERSVCWDGQRITIKRAPLAKLPKYLLQEVCRAAWRKADWPEQAMGHAEWCKLAESITAASTRPFVLPGGVHVAAEGDSLVLKT